MAATPPPEPASSPSPISASPATSPRPTITSTTTSSSEPASEKREVIVISIVIIALSVIVVTILGGVFVCYLVRRRRRRIAESGPQPKPRVLRRRRRRPSEFWSADASKPGPGLVATPAEALDSPRTPNENAGLLGQDQARGQSRRGELIAAVGLDDEANMRGSHPGNLALDVEVDRYATTPNYIQQPTPVHYPDYPAWNGTVYMGQQRQRMAQPDFVQPYASTSYSFEPQHPSEKVSNTVPPRPIITTFSNPTIELEPEPTPYSASASQFSLPSHAQRPFSNLTSASADPFFLDNLILGPAATQNPQGGHRPQSPAHPSTRSSSVSIGTFPLPPTPQTPLQFDVSQALASLREPTSPAILSQRNPPSPSSIRTFSTARRPRFDMVVDEPTPSPRSITSGYFMYPPPQDDIQLQPSQSFTKAPSIRTTGSNPGEPVSCLSIQDSRLSPSPERELDGVHYSRDNYSSSPVLPDSVRTSVLSCSERI